MKQVKEYGVKTKRLRIDIARSDGFTPGEGVVILTTPEYQTLTEELFNLKIRLMECTAKLDDYEDIDMIIQETVKKTLEAI